MIYLKWPTLTYITFVSKKRKLKNKKTQVTAAKYALNKPPTANLINRVLFKKMAANKVEDISDPPFLR